MLKRTAAVAAVNRAKVSMSEITCRMILFLAGFVRLGHEAVVWHMFGPVAEGGV